MITHLTSILQQYRPITLEEMRDVRLMNRKDTKYILPLDKLYEILIALQDEYRVQENKSGQRFTPYHTIYMDTEDHLMYITHITNRLVRQKIRMRTYLDTREAFLEVKEKNNHGRTNKRRIAIPDITDVYMIEEADDFISQSTNVQINSLKKHVENYFNRITLVNQGLTERLTIDVGLTFHNFETNIDMSLDNIAIVELKRDGFAHSPMKDLFIRKHIHPSGFSKYCIGCALTNPALRQNTLKEKLHAIKKINN